MKFQDQLYELRRQRGLSQEQLADLCDVSRRVVSKWENGTANPDLNNVKALASALQVSTDELLAMDVAHEKVFERTRYSKEYTSSITVFGIPLVHICVGRGKTKDGGRHIAKGIIAIGNASIGVISIGLMSAGVFSFGVLTLGLVFALGALSLSCLALGALAIGYIAIGAMAIGVYSIGAISIGFVLSIGAVSYGTTAIGPRDSTFGESVIYLINSKNKTMVEMQSWEGLQKLLQEHELPYFIRFFLEKLSLYHTL